MAAVLESRRMACQLMTREQTYDMLNYGCRTREQTHVCSCTLHRRMQRHLQGMCGECARHVWETLQGVCMVCARSTRENMSALRAQLATSCRAVSTRIHKSCPCAHNQRPVMTIAEETMGSQVCLIEARRREGGSRKERRFIRGASGSRCAS